jgi:hypothetical protein
MIAKGYNEKVILSLLKLKMDVWYQNEVPFVMYIHPSYEIAYKFELLNNILSLINNDNRFELSTLALISAILEARG